MTVAQGLDYPNNIAIDDQYLYWSELGLNSGGGSIKKMPKNGGTITTLVNGLGEVGGLALDKDYVYWTEGDSVNKIAKNATAPTFSPIMSTDKTETFPGQAVTITGQLNSPASASNVTLQYSLDNGKTWSLIAILSTGASGSFSYGWKPAKEGEYLVRAVWTPSIRYQEVIAESALTVASGNLDAITDITHPKTVVGQGYKANTSVTVYVGIPAQPFNMTLYVNQTVIGTLKNLSLTRGSSTTFTFTWNTAGFAKGNYTIKAYATPVPGETDISHNTLVDGIITVTIPGDVDGNHVVNIIDVVKITSIYASKQGNPLFNANSDIDNDGQITILDVVICTSHYAQKYP
jgi:hypothetical protein